MAEFLRYVTIIVVRKDGRRESHRGELYRLDSVTPSWSGEELRFPDVKLGPGDSIQLPVARAEPTPRRLRKGWRTAG